MRPFVTILALIIGFAVLASPLVTFRQDLCWIDATTASMKRQTIWPFGITAGPMIEASAIDLRLQQVGLNANPNWRLLSDTDRTVLGLAISRGCGLAPPIYQLRPVLDEFARTSSDADLREFVRVMQSGTESEQRAAIEAAAEKGLRVLSQPRPDR